MPLLMLLALMLLIILLVLVSITTAAAATAATAAAATAAATAAEAATNVRVAHRPSRSTKSPVVSFLATARRLAESLLVTWLKACWSLGWNPVGHSDDADDNHDDDDDDNHDDDDVDADDDADDEVHAGVVWLLAP